MNFSEAYSTSQFELAGTSVIAKSEAAFFDAAIAKHRDLNPFAASGWRTLSQAFSRCMAGTSELEILEVGCGTGHSKNVFSSHARRIVGLDLSRNGVRLAQQRHPQDTWICGDACRLPFCDSSFDAIVFSSVLHHIPQYLRALHEARRVLRPGGLAFAYDPNVWHPLFGLLRHPRSPLYCSEGVSPNERPLSLRELRRSYIAAGLEIICAQGKSNIAYRQVAPRRINSLLAVFNAADWLWDRIGLGRRFGTFLITAGRRPH